LRYSDFNDALNQVLLSGRNSGRPLYLVLDNLRRRELASMLSLDEARVEDSICSAVGRTLHPSGDPYWRHENDLKAWYSAGRKDPPPCTALLFALSHAAELMHSDGEVSHTNYYQRLSEVTGIDRDRLSAYGRETLKFWNAFSGWLAETDYAHGRPTARQIGGLKYVSLPISQAIVRAEDRDCFHDLFEKYGFTSADEVGLEEMAQYISSWVHGSSASKRIKAAWSRQELRDHVSEIALAELEEWASRGGGASPGVGVSPSGARLSLVANIVPSFPKRRLSLGLGRKWEGEEEVSLVSRPDGSAYTLANVLYGAFATLSPEAGLMPGALVGGISLSSPDGGNLHSWRPRMVIPLGRSVSGAFWVEVTRASLGSEHMVLARDTGKIRGAVETVLADAAAPGYTLARQEQVPGIPGGWVLYQGVRLTRAVDDPPDDAADLSPLGGAADVRPEGGMLLAPGIWHGRAPPLVRLETAGAKGKLEILRRDNEAGPPLASSEAQSGLAIIDLGQLPLEGIGALIARGKVGKQRELTLPLLLRTAESPQPLDRQGRDKFVWAALDSATLSSAAGIGAVCEGLSSSFTDQELVPLSELARHPAIGQQVEAGAGRGDERDPATQVAETAPKRTRVADATAAANLSCGERGFHWFIVETVPPGSPPSTPVAMTCKHCKHSTLRRAKESRRPRATPLPTVPPPRPPDEAIQGQARHVDMDLLLDALCFLGSGTASRLEGLVATSVEEPWEALSIAEDLSVLGHLELRRQPGSGRLLAWSVPSPVVCMTADGQGYMAGFRNGRLMAETSSRLAAAGGILETKDFPGQPCLLRIQGPSTSAVASALSGLVDSLGRQVKVIEAPAQAMASACLGLRAAWSLDRPATLGVQGDLEAFDPSRNKWTQIEGAGAGAGAFRTRSAGMVYLYRNVSGEVIQAPHFLVKLMSARSKGLRLHGYDRASNHFTSAIGCEPPGLLARALCAASGKLPAISQGRSWYPGVTPEVAATILDVLYPREADQ
jgi:hypothetical protein